MSNAIAISRSIAKAGLGKEVADAIAEAVVTHAEESHASKADLAELDSDFRTTLAEFRADMQAEFAKINTQFARIEGRFNTLTAILGINTLLLSAIVIELLFGKGGA